MVTLSAFSTAQRRVADWPRWIVLGSMVKFVIRAEGFAGSGGFGFTGGGGGGGGGGTFFLHPTANRNSVAVRMNQNNLECFISSLFPPWDSDQCLESTSPSAYRTLINDVLTGR
jgi:hypothetical protein